MVAGVQGGETKERGEKERCCLNGDSNLQPLNPEYATALTTWPITSALAKQLDGVGNKKVSREARGEMGRVGKVTMHSPD